MRIKPIPIRTLSDLTEEVETLITGTKLKWWFRGHSCSDWDLRPSSKAYSKTKERYFSNDFFVRAKLRHHVVPVDDDLAGWLALMQHYGLPTRLLDWTRSPLIAAYFATELHQRHMVPCGCMAGGVPSGDACIWAICPLRVNQIQGFGSYLLPLNARSLHKLIRPSRKGKDTTSKVAAALAIETDIRMQMQQGAFTVHSNDLPLNKMPGCDKWLRKYLIPEQYVHEMARQLDLLGFRLGDLFPDLGNLARELKATIPPDRKR